MEGPTKKSSASDTKPCEDLKSTTEAAKDRELLDKVKRIIHGYPEKAVEVMLKGIAAAHPGLVVDVPSKIIYLKKARGEKVAIVTGGGSGHEPFGAGYVGEGMVTACVAGSIFASPSSKAVLTGIIKAAEFSKSGVLVIHLNYTGDVINFGIAAEEAKARGFNVENYVVGDDVSTAQRDSIAGKRGIAGSLFILKVAGGMSSAGEKLSKITTECNQLGNRVASMGACLSPGSIPGQPPMFYIAPDEIYLGVGIHGEAGVKAIEELPGERIVKILMDRIADHLKLSRDAQLCVIINNLGTMTPMEMYIIGAEVKSYLDKKGYSLKRMYCGSFLTSLDMNGFQVSVLDCSARLRWIDYLDGPTDAFAWPAAGLAAGMQSIPAVPLTLQQRSELAKIDSLRINDAAKKVVGKVLEAVCNALLDEEERLNRLDAGAGDADTGSTLADFARGLKKDWEGELGKSESIGQLLLGMSRAAEREMGGTSGGLYSLLLLGAARHSNSWKAMPLGAVTLLRRYTNAQPGDRTMLDALIPAAKTFEETLNRRQDDWKAALRAAVTAAQEGAAATKNMTARAGRASYVDSSLVKQVDPGAHAVVVWISAIATALEV